MSSLRAIRTFRAVFTFLLGVGLVSAGLMAHAATAATAKSSKHRAHKLAAHHRTHGPILRGQQSIDSDRATEIQQALIREHYLSGDPTGRWDPATVAAMQKYQGDQGWQTKLMPDSRALKKLGLGPDYSNALNAQNSSFAGVPSVSTPSADHSAERSTDQNPGFAAASGVKQ